MAPGPYVASRATGRSSPPSLGPRARDAIGLVRLAHVARAARPGRAVGERPARSRRDPRRGRPRPSQFEPSASIQARMASVPPVLSSSAYDDGARRRHARAAATRRAGEVGRGRRVTGRPDVVVARAAGQLEVDLDAVRSVTRQVGTEAVKVAEVPVRRRRRLGRDLEAQPRGEDARDAGPERGGDDGAQQHGQPDRRDRLLSTPASLHVSGHHEHRTPAFGPGCRAPAARSRDDRVVRARGTTDIDPSSPRGLCASAHRRDGGDRNRPSPS